MKRKIYWKDILRSFTSSKGRFLSILILMMLGSLALVGLKVAPPNMRRTATDYLKEQRTMDLAVMADYGLDAADQKELEAIKGADVEFGYLTDVTVDEEALRAGELVILARNDVNGQLFLGQVGTGKLKVFGSLVLVFFDLG